MTKPIDRRSATLAREAQSQFNELTRSLRAAQASLDRFHNSLHVPVIRTPRGRIPGSRSNGSIFTHALGSGLGRAFSQDIISGGNSLFNDGGAAGFFDDMTGSDSGNLFGTAGFLPSGTQLAGLLLDRSQRAQRIR